MADDGTFDKPLPEKPHNPFADDPSDASLSDDPYAPPREAEYNPHVAGHYNHTIPDRGGTLFALGITGLLLAVSGSVAILFCLPINLLALAFSVPAWVMARHDLRGMDLGAIASENRGRTRAGYWLGMVGSAVALLPIMAVVVLLAIDIGTAPINDFRDWLGW